MYDPRASAPPPYPHAPYAGPGPGPGGPSYPPVQAWQGAQTPARTSQTTKVAALAVAGGAALIVLLAVLRIFVLPASAPKGPHSGSIKYGHDGWTDGTVEYSAEVKPEDARVVGDYLRAKGWFRGESFDKSLSRHARGSYGYGAASRGYGQPQANVSVEDGLATVIVFTTKEEAELDEVKEFGADAHTDLSTKLARPVKFVVRSETKKGRGLEWDDLVWD